MTYMRIPLLDTFSAFNRDYNCAIRNVLYIQIAKLNSIDHTTLYIQVLTMYY